jgi:hypothetical protein
MEVMGEADEWRKPGQTNLTFFFFFFESVLKMWHSIGPSLHFFVPEVRSRGVERKVNQSRK